MTIVRIGLAAVGALAVGGAVAALVGSGTVLSLLTQAVIYAVFASGVGLLLRQNGMVSFGHALYFGLSGYALGIVLQLGWMPAELALVAVLAAIGAVAFVVGLVIVRVPGVAFSMMTLAIGQMLFLTASRSRGLTGGADGMNINWPSTLFGVPQSLLLKPAVLFLVCWCVMVLVVAGLALLLRGRFGAVTEAVRDNEERARFIGLRTLAPRAAIYALSAVIAALGGSLSALNTGFVSPEALHWSVSGVALMMVVVGGYRALWGPPLGAIVYFLFKDVLGDWASHWMAIFGIALITVIVFSPTGLAGALERLGPARRKRAAAGRPASAH
ncbi:branched-chain amino acid ABC transporter permease [Xenophilus sp.]|uniref:branched-chain amino acid ABC transporter permease n=1 Tax=Xenophilus sp. TaxID=1873499 RepID=UPI0037DC20DC